MKIGDVIVVKPGERVPLDGVILNGSSSLDTSALTRESMPQEVTVGNEIVSGCINISGVLRVSVTKTYQNSTVAKILDLVEHASRNKARSEALLRALRASILPSSVPRPCCWPLYPRFSSARNCVCGWNERSPFWSFPAHGALVISVPLTFFGGIGGASKTVFSSRAVIISNCCPRAETVVFDKTGTLTEGIFRVTTIHPQALTGEELLKLAATLESYSSHPIALSNRAHNRIPVHTDTLTDVKDLQGYGLSAQNQGHQYLIGNQTLMEQHGISFPCCPHAGVVVHVAEDGCYLGIS